MERVPNPHHYKAVGYLGDESRGLRFLDLNCVVKIFDGLSKPHANDQERSQAYHEAQKSNPCRSTLEEWFTQRARKFCTKRRPEGDKGEKQEEEYGKCEGNGDECWCG